MKYCVFCDRDPLESRVYYDRDNWYAFLTSPPYVQGHTGLAVKRSGISCPTELTHAHLRGLDNAISDVAQLLLEHFIPKDVLFASLRGRESHLHLHLIPLWQDDEDEWRSQSGHERGHLFEYLGNLEKTRQLRAEQERNKRGWSEEEQRSRYMPQLQSDVDSLRALSSYRSA